MFRHDKKLQFYSKPTTNDPVLAKQVQELIGGAYGEMTVMMQYLFQGWTCKGAPKYRDMLLEVGSEEIGHVEMLATMVTHLLEKAPFDVQEAAAHKTPVIGAIMGGENGKNAVMEAFASNPQHMIVTGGTAAPTDSVGYPWNGRYVTASGNLLADFRVNLAAESQGRLQACRVYELAHAAGDEGVMETLKFMIARDSYHQQLWAAAIEELENAGDMRGFTVPVQFDDFPEMREHAYTFWGLGDGAHAQDGRWAKGASLDGKGEKFTYLKQPEGLSPQPTYGEPNPRLYGGGKLPQRRSEGAETSASASSTPGKFAKN